MLRYLRMGNKRTKTIWWILIVVTVVTFVGGFIFMFGAGFDSTRQARATGSVGTINGGRVTRTEYQTAINEARAQYQRQYPGTEPNEQDERVLEVQAWRSLVIQRLMSEQARQAGLKAADREVVLAMQTNPPSMLVASPAFQTDGKFDPSKYQAAMRNPTNNWSEIEDMVRAQLPMRKLQERLIGSLKIAEPEMLEAFRNQNEKVSAIILQVPASATATVPTPTDADLQRTYDLFKDRFVSGPRTQLEVLAMPRKLGDEEVRAAHETAASLVHRARGGEDFAQLAKDYSEGPGADKGGEVGQVVSPQDFGPQMGPAILALPVGGISEPMRDGTRFLVFKVLERVPAPNGGITGLRVAQIVTKIRAGEAAARAQEEELNAIRDRAKRIGLGKAAAEKGLSTRKTESFDYNNPPQSLFAVPEAGEWGVSAKVGAISPVFQGPDEYLIAECAQQRPAGAPPREELTEPLRNISELYARVEASKPRADSISSALKSGQTFEQVSKAFGVASYPVDGVTRLRPDPRLSACDDLVGALFSAVPGKVIGPYRALNGWYFGRVTGHSLPDTAGFDSLRANLSTQIMGQRQRTFMSGYMADLRAKAKVEDLRGVTGP